MPRFSVINPDDGTKVFFEAPEGASEDQIQRLAEAALSQPAQPPMAPGEIPEPYSGEPVPRQEAGRQYGIGESALGAAEAGLSLATGVGVGLPMMAGGTVQGIVEAILNAQSKEEAANILEQYITRAAEAGTYTPRTEAGRKFAGMGAEALASLPPIMGVSGGAAPFAAARQGARAGVPGVSGATDRAIQAIPGVRETSRRELTGRDMRSAELAVAKPMERVAEVVEDVAGGVGESIDELAAKFEPRAGRPVVSATREQVREAEAAGIPIMTSDIRPPETVAEQFVQRVVERIPFFGTGKKRSAQQKARVEAANKLVKEYGIEDEGVLTRILESMNEAKAGIVNKYDGMKQDVLKNMPAYETERISLNNTLEWINRTVADLRATNTPISNASADWLEGQRDQFTNMLVSKYDDVRADVGKGISIDERTGTAGPEKGRLSLDLYRVMNDEFGDLVKERRGEAEFNKWKIGNTRLRELIEDEETSVISKILNTGVEQPGSIINILTGKNNESQLRRINKFLDDKGRTNVRQAIVRDLGMLASDKTAVDPNKMNANMFGREIRKFNNAIKVFFTPEEQARIRGLRTALELTDRASKANVLTPTGQELSPLLLSALGGVGMYGLAQTVGLIGGAVAAGGGLMAGRIYESKAIRNLFLQLGKAESDVQKSKIFSQLRKAISAEMAKAPAAPASQVGATQLRELEEPNE
jgi:hypothetical protein